MINSINQLDTWLYCLYLCFYYLLTYVFNSCIGKDISIIYSHNNNKNQFSIALYFVYFLSHSFHNFDIRRPDFLNQSNCEILRNCRAYGKTNETWPCPSDLVCLLGPQFCKYGGQFLGSSRGPQL
jgi:hypothetical protein